jgi:GPCR proteolysis site, GPS, motif
MNRLAVADRSTTAPNTNVSRSVSVSILDFDGNEVAIRADPSHPIEIIIPRDQNLLLPPMILQNVTALSLLPHAQIFNLHFVNLSTLSSSSFSIHLQLHPLTSNLSYLLVYKFDQPPRLNSSISDIDGWSLFCSSTLHTHSLNNQQTNGHRSIIFGIRQLNSTEVDQLCINQVIHVDPPRSDQAFAFTLNYELRLYTSGCFYLDADHRWRSDGLVVGPLTNLSQTQCLSTHLTTFAGGFLVLPAPINWNYVFAHADFNKNKTIYLTVIIAVILYVLLIAYARRNDKKDIEKVRETHFTRCEPFFLLSSE